MTSVLLRSTSTPTGPGDSVRPTLVLTGTRAAPLTNQAVVAAVAGVAAVCSLVLPGVTITDAVSMWAGIALAFLGLAFTALLLLRPDLARLELLVPALDFVAIGLLRFGTGDARSPFLAAVLLPVIWIAARPGRRNVVYPLIGTAGTFLVPMVLTDADPGATEMVRLGFVLLVFAAVAWVTNELARQAAIRLRHVQELRRVAEDEIGQAALVQRSLLPTSLAGMPSRFTVRGVCLPTRSVGGDFYDWFPTANGAAFTLGDVMGKGVGAGMIAAVVRSVLRATTRTGSPSEAVGRAAIGVDTGGDGSTSEQFTTCFHAHVDTDGTVHWVDAGHGLAMVVRHGGGLEWLRGTDLPIGVGATWTTHETSLRPGDVLVTVSDGVLDLFGDDLDEMAACVLAHADPDDLVAQVERLGRGAHPEDDVTVLAVRFEADAAPDPVA
ncbi:PP2C family protein-serine/threonine phosphatase [Frigoribacterium sp. PhB24]|uniref:PP2C family protein-serine/threonine phosphatase n=1 Tax=Frigoribacterium sp. PhB24 TaxID=2485204 RepID=UPI0011CE6B1C|nr:SpoIIE family protein phosphatase [Frigoribacterium sp. PhB24]